MMIDLVNKTFTQKKQSTEIIVPPPSLWGFMTNNPGLSMALLMISESSKLHKPAKHFLNLAMSSLLSRNLIS